MTNSSRNHQRDSSIDLMKGVLTLLMTLSHFLYFTGWKGSLVDSIHDYIDLTSFSGFLFCFGYVSWSAYIDTDKPYVEKRIIASASKILIAYYISGIAFIAGRDAVNIQNILGIMLFQSLPGISEFLLSFIILDCFILIFKKEFMRIKTKTILIIMLFSLSMCWFPYEVVVSPVMGNIIGMKNSYCFPVIQYCSYFLFGLLLAKNKIVFNKYVLMIVVFATCTYYSYYNFVCIPSRFPPSLLFIIGAALFVYLYYLISKLLQDRGVRVKCVDYVGRHTLVYLVVGNFIVFTCQWRITHNKPVPEFNSNGGILSFIIIYFLEIIISTMISELFDQMIMKNSLST